MPASLLAEAIGQLSSQPYSLLLLVGSLHSGKPLYARCDHHHHSSADIINLRVRPERQHVRFVMCYAFMQRMRIYVLLRKLTHLNSGDMKGASRCKADAALDLLHKVLSRRSSRVA